MTTDHRCCQCGKAAPPGPLPDEWLLNILTGEVACEGCAQAFLALHETAEGDGTEDFAAMTEDLWKAGLIDVVGVRDGQPAHRINPIANALLVALGEGRATAHQLHAAGMRAGADDAGEVDRVIAALEQYGLIKRSTT